MTFYGADISQLRALAKAADQAAALLGSRAGTLHSQIQSAPWKGRDGERFRQEWNASHRPGLDKVVASLRENSRILMKHADEQEKASTSRAGGSGGSAWDRLTSLASQARDWFQEKAEAARELAEHHRELASGLDRMLNASPEEQAKWWAGLSDADRKYLIQG
ncbi:MAG: hypothetical protein ACLGH7_04585, partial [Actinomycetes bacterium]